MQIKLKSDARLWSPARGRRRATRKSLIDIKVRA